MMKRKFALLSLLVLLSGLSIAQKKEFKELKGLIRFGEPMLYISSTELSNGEYNEYLNWLKVYSDSSTYKAALLDTQAWRVLAYNEPLVNHYHDHPAYDDYPAVNMSQEQARKYCEWRQARLIEYLRMEGSEIDSIIVRLPTEKEWMVAARLGLPDDAPFSWPEKGMRNTQSKRHMGEIRGNFKRGSSNIAGRLNDNSLVATPVKSYWPNPAGCWNMSGNVSEWINESGKSKGGSWKQGAYRCRIDQPGAHDGDSMANPEIGFRFMVEIVSLKRKVEIKPFDIEKAFYINRIKLNDSVWMQSTELSNLEYQQFLMENTNDSFKIQHALWLKYFPYAHYTLYGNQDKYLNHPVVNVSYEAALAYCNWLTLKYNAWENKPFKEVIFRLPTQAEWELAARGGRQGNYYPWGGPYTRNSKGCYIANYRPLEDQYFNTDSDGNGYYVYPDSNLDISLGVDGAVIPTSVYGYFPNDHGYYNMAGNVAEMVSDKGISRGGSWRSNEDEIRIKAIGTYTGPDPTLGFRVVMEIVRK